MAKRGRIPVKYIQVLRLLQPCKGWENGKKIDEIAMAVYGSSDFRHKAMARMLIGVARNAANVQIFSIKPVGTEERRYCHLLSITEYTKAINDFERHIEGTQNTKEDLEAGRETVEERRRLEEARKVAARVKIEERQAEKPEEKQEGKTEEKKES